MMFHHLGWACRDIRSELAAFEVLGYSPEGAPFVDPIQGIQGQFIQGPGPRLELLAELDGSTVLQPWLGRGVNLYHQAFVVPSLESELERLRTAGAILVSTPQPSVAFEGSLISFVMLANGALIELIGTAGAE